MWERALLATAGWGCFCSSRRHAGGWTYGQVVTQSSRRFELRMPAVGAGTISKLDCAVA